MPSSRRRSNQKPSREPPVATGGVPLAPYAASDATSRGRRHPEVLHGYRSQFQRDRDRILHSAAFRRLVYKTQVFINHEGDLYRTRLTHSLEVAQIGRTVAANLGLNQPLTEAICLAHDLGHTPFGHAGQDALNRCMRPWGGFEHNLQSLRVVDALEDRYLTFAGLNLCFETREGILKHCSKASARQLGDVGRRFLDRRQPGLEAQLSNLADEIAYNNHDVDDGLRAGLLDVSELAELDLFGRHYRTVRRLARKRRPQMSERVLIHETVRRMINEVVSDLIETSRERIAAAAPPDIDAVRARQRPLIALSPRIAAEHLALKRFLRQRLYRHERVLAVNRRAQQILSALFACYQDNLAVMPAEHRDRARLARRRQGEAGAARAVADYLAGMTDRYAVSAYRRLVDSSLDW